jgi:hypothetical protein
LINFLGVSPTGAIFLAAHYSSSIISSSQKISDLLLKRINDVGPMQQIVREQVKSLSEFIHTSFGLGVWCTP